MNNMHCITLYRIKTSYDNFFFRNLCQENCPPLRNYGASFFSDNKSHVTSVTSSFCPGCLANLEILALVFPCLLFLLLFPGSDFYIRFIYLTVCGFNFFFFFKEAEHIDK